MPVVGLVLIDAQPEYGERDLHEEANAAIRAAARRPATSRSSRSTRASTRTRPACASPAQVESLIARMDAVLTTRLHGLVLALKNGVPALAIDPFAAARRSRIRRDTLGWSVLAARHCTPAALEAAFDACLSDAARAKARLCAASAAKELTAVRKSFLAELSR